jgi:hypothetical protein
MEVFCDASTLLSAVETNGQLKLECPHHFHLLEVLITSMVTSVLPERGLSWLKQFLTRLSQGVRAAHLDNCMQVAMNAPADDTDDSDFYERVVIKFCVKRKRHLDSSNYNDEPSQKPKKRVLGPRANGKLTAAQIKCHSSSFTNAPITKKCYRHLTARRYHTRHRLI